MNNSASHDNMLQMHQKQRNGHNHHHQLDGSGTTHDNSNEKRHTLHNGTSPIRTAEQLGEIYPAVGVSRTTSLRRGHARSPSDGDKPFLLDDNDSETFVIQAPTGRLDNESLTIDDSSKSPSKGGVAFLRRLFGLRSKSCNREDKRISLYAADIEQHDENQNPTVNVNAHQKSQTLPALSRRNVQNHNNNNIIYGQNTLPTPPIAVFCSDEDIASRTDENDNGQSRRQSNTSNRTIQKEPVAPVINVVLRRPGRRRVATCRHERAKRHTMAVTCRIPDPNEMDSSSERRVQSVPVVTSGSDMMPSFSKETIGTYSPAHRLGSCSAGAQKEIWNRDVLSFDSGIQPDNSIESLQVI